MTTVKKYGNRRLYDTESSRYITLEELASKIRAGSEVRVIDARTEEDLTQATLTQIILESRRAARLLPIPLLMQLIRMGDDALAEFFGRYMSWALEMYLTVKGGAQKLQPFNPLMMTPFNAAQALANMMSAPAPATPPAAPPSDDVAEIRRELEELKKSMRRKRR
jgi:polyhydroxyalkanoate synthesis repressor PhaR